MTPQACPPSRHSLIVALAALASAASAVEPSWTHVQTSGMPKTIASIAADLDNDGRDEVVYVGSSGRAYWTRHPDWTINSLSGNLGTDEYLMAVGVGDFNRDGYLDVVAPSDGYTSGPARLYLWLNPGAAGITGTWQRSSIYSGVSAYHQNDLAVGDLDGDGKLDVAIRSRDATNRVIVALQNTVSSWTVRTFATGESIFPEGIAIGDVDGDGWNDIVLSGVYWSRPGGWRSGSPVATTYDEQFVGKAVKSAFADIDGDGSEDLYVGAAERWYVYLAWYRRNPDGTLTRRLIKDAFGNCHSVVWRDVDRDGALDLITGQTFQKDGVATTSTLVFYNRSGGTSWPMQTVSPQGKYFAAAGDFDGDGDIDITGPVEYNANTSPYVHYNQLNPPAGGDDTTAPTQPGSLTATATGSTTVALSWTASTDNVGVTGYEVQRGSTVLATVTGTSYADSGLTAATTYSYSVRAKDAAGNISSAATASATTDAATPDTTAPTQPGSLTATATSATAVSLSWTASTDAVGVTGYEVSRGGSVVATVTGTSYADSGLAPETAYSYAVRARDAAGNWSTAATASATTPAAPAAGDPLVWWRFEEGSGTTVADAGQNGWPGTLTNGAGWTTGPDGGAALLANPSLNETRHVSGGSRPVGGGTAVTVAAWMRNDGTTGYTGALVSHLNRSGGTYKGGWELTLSSGALSFSKGDPGAQTFNGAVTTSALAALGDGQWHHVAVTWSATTGTTRIYLDGVEVQSGSQPSASLGAVDATLRAGLSAINSKEFHGALDEVRIYGSALDAATIAILAEGGGSGGGDTTAPTAPGGLAATATGPTAVSLAWTASTDDVSVAGYEVSRDGALLGTVTATSYADSGLTASTTYSYSVVALDAAGNRSTAATAGVTTPAAPSAGEPLVWWRFTEGSGITVADSGQSGWTGTLVNGASWTTGPADGAVLLANPTLSEVQHVAGGSRPLGNPDAVTVAVWIRNDGGQSYAGSILSFLNRAAGTYHGGYELGISSGKLTFSKGDPAAGTFNTQLASPVLAVLGDGQWHHVAATWSAATGISCIYLDGLEVAAGSQPSASLGAVEAQLRLGNSSINNREFAGAVDELRIYGSALDTVAIEALAAGGMPQGDG